MIVAESNQVTIYDGDDPDLPMWMVFNANGSTTTFWYSTRNTDQRNATMVFVALANVRRLGVAMRSSNCLSG